MAPEKTPLRNDSNWTFMYVVLGLIPVAFVAVTVYSTCRTMERGNDIEMAVQTQPSQRPRFPWREAVTAPGRPQHSNPYEVQAASSREKQADRHTGDNENTTGIAVSGLYEYGKADDKPSNSRRYSQDFEAVPL
ncbi:hypothetical protein F4820DRAFT_445166 [Hypoxylon rubiginosum]|uniref:Uncharacterized protein n=1 Tax=Hypoxylon rubiginosum TaxID=110542 RepID=A0ACB9ZB54_9PEZI|nr:hypothetical protein F4820DRAFT_445166 [Hypoxylon rubiginosum]